MRPPRRALRGDAGDGARSRDGSARSSPTLDHVPQGRRPERVRDEWVKTMKARVPSRAFDVMRKTGILGVTCPELLEGDGMEQNKWHAPTTCGGTAWSAWSACAGDPILRIAAASSTTSASRARAPGQREDEATGRSTSTSAVGAEIAGADPRRPPPLLERREGSASSRLCGNAHLFHYFERLDRTRRCAAGCGGSGP